MPSRQSVESRSGTDHLGDLGVVERRREAGEHVTPHGFHQLVVRCHRREHDDLQARPDRAQLGGEREILAERRRRTRDDDIHGAVAYVAHGFDVAVAEVRLVHPGGEDFGQRLDQRSVRTDREHSPRGRLLALLVRHPHVAQHDDVIAES